MTDGQFSMCSNNDENFMVFLALASFSIDFLIVDGQIMIMSQLSTGNLKTGSSSA
jgi:hypothetical protein